MFLKNIKFFFAVLALLLPPSYLKKNPLDLWYQQVRDEQLIRVFEFFARHFSHPLPTPLLQLRIALNIFGTFRSFMFNFNFLFNLLCTFRFNCGFFSLPAPRSFLIALQFFLVSVAGDYFVLGAGKSPRVQLAMGHVGQRVGKVVIHGNSQSAPLTRF